MTIADYIEANMDALLRDWDGFAASMATRLKCYDAAQLRRSAARMLHAVAQASASAHSRAGERGNGRGEGPLRIPDITASARRHAAERLNMGFTLIQVVAEYRALRTSVIRHWCAHLEAVGEAEMSDLCRFNEAIDQSLNDAIDWFMRQLEQARSLLNGVLAHDLRFPLWSIDDSAELLRDALDEPLATDAARICSACQRIQTIVGDLLDFTRTRYGRRLPLALGRCDLHSLCKAVVDDMNELHPHTRVRLESSGAPSGSWDRMRIEQLITNLVDNAVRYGERAAPVTVSVAEDGDSAVLAVHNTGNPIPPEGWGSMFEPLQRVAMHVDDGPGDGGPGLGLYICRQIVDAHKGSIRVASSPQDGTSFTVRLPRLSGAGADPPSRS